MKRLHRASLLAAALVVMAAPAVAGQVVLRPNLVDNDGRVTMGDLFEGAGAAAEVTVALRSGPSVVLEARQVQALARQAGLQWDNPDGLRRIAVRRGDAAPASAGAQAATPPDVASPGLRQTDAGRQVIARNDMVRVYYQVGGVNLSVMGKAMRNAAIGEPVAVMNTASSRIIDAVASGPGQAVAGPAAIMARSNSRQFAAR